MTWDEFKKFVYGLPIGDDRKNFYKYVIGEISRKAEGKPVTDIGFDNSIREMIKYNEVSIKKYKNSHAIQENKWLEDVLDD